MSVIDAINTQLADLPTRLSNDDIFKATIDLLTVQKPLEGDGQIPNGHQTGDLCCLTFRQIGLSEAERLYFRWD